jgi:tRNA dimethylallyltransferase
MVPASGLETRVAILSGPTATGKSGIALEYARKFAHSRSTDLELINADSMLVYRGMDIGTAKPSREELQEIPHHLVSIRNPNEQFTAGEFYRLANEAISEIHSRGKRALIVGGTGFYLKALLFGLWETPPSHPQIREKLERLPNPELFTMLEKKDPPTAYRIGPNDRYRLIRALEMIELSGKTVTALREEAPTQPDPRFELLVMDRETEELNQRISLRSSEMLTQGLIDEVQTIEAQFPNAASLGAVGYAQVRHYLAGHLPAGRKIKPGIPGLLDEIELATRQLVKRQRTWFRGVLNQPGQGFATAFTLDADREKLFRKLEEIYE